MWYFSFMVLLRQHVSVKQESMHCGSSMSKLTSGQPVKDSASLLQVYFQVLLAHLPNIESTCRVFVSSSFLHAALYI